MSPHRRKTILLLGILACCGGFFLTGLPAWVMANDDLSRMDAEGRGLTQAGKLCGIIGTALTGVALIAVVVINVGEGSAPNLPRVREWGERPMDLPSTFQYGAIGFFLPFTQ